MTQNIFIVSFDQITRHQFQIDDVNSDQALKAAGQRLLNLSQLAEHQKPAVLTFSRVTVDQLPIAKGGLQ